MSIATLVLAACMPGVVGTPRQLALEEGQPLVRLVAAAALVSSSDAVVVVTGGPRTDRVEAALAGLDVITLPNTRWMEGVASSVRAGVAWADAQGFDAIVIASADRLRASSAHFDAVMRLHRRGHAVVATQHEGVLGLPALFARASFRALMALMGDRGPSELLGPSHAAVEWIDSPAERAPTRSGYRLAVRTTRGRTARRGS